jgi:hypothetical protein
MNITHLDRGSFFNDFEDDRMTGVEMFDTLGGIERNGIVEEVIIDNLAFEDTVFDDIVPDWKAKIVDSLMVQKICLKNHRLFFPVRSFRTLLQFLCIRFK